jgi:hypothetical protein
MTAADGTGAGGFHINLIYIRGSKILKASTVPKPLIFHRPSLQGRV